MRFVQSVAVCAVVLAALLFGTPPDAGAVVFSPQSFMLPNGMQVVVVTNRRAPIVAHMVWYKVGAADEPAGKSGIAHFFEHLMFKGTKSFPPGEFSRIVARNGGTENAFTTQDYTAYFQKVARDKLELVMKLESDRMSNLILTDKEVLPERDVVLEERRSRTDNDPGAQLHEASQAALFLNHPYKIPVIGWKHEIAALTTKDALDFYRGYYVPNNAILIVAGDITVDELRPLAEKYYGTIARGADIVRNRVSEPPHLAARRVEMDSPRVGQPAWSRYYTAPSYRTAKGNQAYALQVFSDIIGGGTTSRLYRSLVVEQGIAASAGAWYNPNQFDSGTFGLSVSPRPGTTLATAEKALLADIDAILKIGVTAAEVARAKKKLVASAVYARDSLSAAPNVIGGALATGRTIEEMEAWPDRINAVTLDQVNEAARAVLVERQSVTNILRPSSPKKD
ncbi:MAG: pitrilysin family protein [Proteobacteria bacterium]|nr:pitrilysin family protein [Pseudomonadota bacterium]